MTCPVFDELLRLGFLFYRKFARMPYLTGLLNRLACLNSRTRRVAIAALLLILCSFGIGSCSTLMTTARHDNGVLLLLVPDNQDLSDPLVLAWQDAASEQGVRLKPMTDAQFLKLGRRAHDFAGLILPDSIHIYATNELIAAITTYTKRGGHTMLVYDFGALERINGMAFYAMPTSRMSALAGVDYVLYETLRAKTTGWGPVRALKSTMRELLVPPGKSMPYRPSPQPSGYIAVPAKAGSGGGPNQAPNQAPDKTQVMPVSPKLATSKGVTTVAFGQRQLTTTASAASPTAVTDDDALHAYHGYLLGHLDYPSFVTQGDFGWPTRPQQVALADSPHFGLVAGINPVGRGKVLFVNLPLTYLKGRTDALLMHGFLHYFTRNLLNMTHLSAMPNGVAGMTFDWHLDYLYAQKSTLALMALNVFSDPNALFSIDLTAGPDTISVGDRRGFNLPANPVAQHILRTFDQFGHSVGSHGGWIHDYAGDNITETNQFASSGGACVNPDTLVDNFEQCYVLNHQAVNGAVGRRLRSYSAPLGNNPPWAMSWLEERGVVAAYFGGHTGLGATRHYRDGKLLNPKMWVFPVTPAGVHATFEEWQAHDVPKDEINQWYRELIDFSIAQNTSRLVYAHPPGAYKWSDVLLNMLEHAKKQYHAGKLNWYTMERLADFMTTRLDVTWTQATDTSGVTRFDASHPSNLNEMTWRLPRAVYDKAPRVVLGTAAVLADEKYWLVRAGVGQHIVFTAIAIPR